MNVSGWVRLREDTNVIENPHAPQADSRGVAASPVSRKIRVIKCVCDFGSGGTEGQVFNLVCGLDANRYELAFAALNRTGPFVEEYATRGIAIHGFPINSFFSLAALVQMIRLARHLRTNRIEIMHAYNFYSLVFAIPAAKLAGVPVIIASIRDRGVYLTNYQTLLQKLVCRLADRVLVNAEAIRGWLLEQGYAEEKITVIKNGIDLSRYHPVRVSESHGSSIRRDWGIEDNATLVVMLARLNRQKGVADFIQAVARLKQDYPQTRFLIIGKPSLDSVRENGNAPSDYQQWLSLRKELDLEECLIFCGHRNDIPRILSQATVSVLPSHSEGISNTLLESMAAGVPVVATSVGGTPELIEDGVDGVLVPAHSPDRLAEGIRKILDDAALALTLSQSARRKAQQHFSLEAMVSKTEKVYASHLRKQEALS